jgi:hypothetical protein
MVTGFVVTSTEVTVKQYFILAPLSSWEANCHLCVDRAMDCLHFKFLHSCAAKYQLCPTNCTDWPL